jgi:hypothetical protein
MDRKHIENAGPEAGRNSDELMKQRRNGGCKNSGADGAWVEAKGPKNGRRAMEVRRRAERQSGGCGAERSGRNWDQRLGILTFSTWCTAGNRGERRAEPWGKIGGSRISRNDLRIGSEMQIGETMQAHSGAMNHQAESEVRAL